MNNLPVIVDTNIIFSILLNNNSPLAKILLSGDFSFYIGEIVLVELFKHKDKIVRLSRLTDDELVKFYHILLRKINFYKEDLIQVENLRFAYELCEDIDVNDTLNIALTLELQGLLWTGDRRLKQGLISKGFHRFFEY